MAIVDDEDLRFYGDPAELFAALAELIERERPAWHADALCREPAYRHLDWFPGQGAPTAPLIAVCQGCLVRAECAAAGRDEEGIWGGLGAQRRRSTVPPNTNLLGVIRRSDPTQGPSTRQRVVVHLERQPERWFRVRDLVGVVAVEGERRADVVLRHALESLAAGGVVERRPGPPSTSYRFAC